MWSKFSKFEKPELDQSIPFSVLFPRSSLPLLPLCSFDARAIRGRCGAIAVCKRNGGRVEEGEEETRESITDTRRQRRHSWNGDTCFLARFLRPSSELPSSQASIVDLASLADRNFRCQRIFSSREKKRRGEEKWFSLCFSFLLPFFFFFFAFFSLLFVSSNRVNRIFCSVFDGGHLIWEGTGGERDDKFGVNFAYFGIIHQSIAAYVTNESDALTRLPDSRLIALIYLYRGFLSASEKGGPWIDDDSR